MVMVSENNKKNAQSYVITELSILVRAHINVYSSTHCDWTI